MGLDLCVQFRQPRDEATIVREALAKEIELRPLSYYANRVATPECAVAPGLLLGFAAIPPAEIKHGVSVLASVLRNTR